MAYSTGNATNYSDLLDALITFATAHGWTLHNDKRGTVGEVTLKGTGLTGTDAIFVGIKRFADAGTDRYGWILQGYTGFTDAGFMSNPGAISNYLPTVPLWNDTIKYWFFVNARRIVMVAKVSTVYVAIYLGYILPYGSPGQWPYPLCIGGSNVTDITGTGVVRYSDTGGFMGVPFIPLGTTTQSPLVIRTADGTWQRLPLLVQTIPPVGISSPASIFTARGVWPYIEKFVESGSPRGWSQLRPNQAGDYPLLPLRLMRGDTPDALGIFDGVRFVPGYGLSAEDTVTQSTDTWIVFQDTYKTALDSFFAVLEA
jgi:hypothetical protein